MRDLVLPAIGALEDVIVGPIVGSAISTLGSKLSQSLFFAFSVGDRSAVVETMI